MLGNPGIAKRIALALVWIAIAVSGIVFTEPAPTDAIMLGLLVLLPTIGLVAISPLLVSYVSLWMVAAAAGLLAATMAPELGRPVTFTFVSFFLYLASFIIAAFVAKDPKAHTELILRAWVVAAVVATAAALLGYFQLAPGAFDLFTRFGRATGTFKDPNVFGPFLVAPFLYALHVALDMPLKRMGVPLAVAGLLALGVFLSFSRGAWMNLAAALAIYGWLAFVTAQSNERRKRILQLVAAGAVVICLVVVAALQNERIVELLTQRASLTQSYDVGPEGRFGGQQKALDLIYQNPLGIGATVFASVYHHEEVHNVYLSMMLNAGWVGGSIFWLMVMLTVGIGLRHVFKPGPAQPLLIIAFATFAANAFEGVIIDLDHWRHVYVLMAIVWGIASATGRQTAGTNRRRT